MGGTGGCGNGLKGFCGVRDTPANIKQRKLGAVEATVSAHSIFCQNGAVTSARRPPICIYMCVCVCVCVSVSGDVVVISGRSCHRAAPCFLLHRSRSLLRACPRRKAPIGVEHALSCLTV
jgi:hypothetical protein